MSTIVGVKAPSGVVLAGDRRNVENGTVTSDAVERILDLGYAAVAAVGDPGDVAEFSRTLESELDRYRTERGTAPSVEAVGRSAAERATSTDVEAIVAGRSDEGVELRTVGADGGFLADDRAAFGTGRVAALAVLDDASMAEDLAEATDQVRDVLATVADRDPNTGRNVDVVTVGNDGGR